MTRWNEGVFDPYLPAELVLRQAEIGVIVADRQGNVLFVNDYLVRLLRLPGDTAKLAGQPLHALGFIPDEDLPRVADLSRQVLSGTSWEGTFTGTRGDGGMAFVRALAVPLRHPSGDIDGMAIVVTAAGRRDTRREQDRIRLLERVGERLAGSLELDATLRHVAQILVPQFADHCFIDLLSGDKLIRRAQAHVGGWEPPPGTWASVGEPIYYPPGHFCQQAMARLETIVVPDLHAAYYPAPSAESMSASDQAGLTSVLAAPLYARGELLGVMALALSRLTEREDPHYDLPDGDLIGAIAGRVAVAIDNAMLFEAERHTALAFQQSLLPQEIPDLDGLEVAFRYVPAKPLETQGQGIQTQVGGDWYDIIPLAAGRVGLVIGDVEGRGAQAAATMGQLRATLRAYAQDEKGPADIMHKLDEWFRSTAPVGATGDPPTASCIYMIYDAWARELTFANAGHAAPLMVSGGAVRPLEVRHKGILLGVRGRGIRGLPTYKEQTVKLPPGASLVLYTDGLTDRRSRADGSGHYTEAEAVAMLRDAILAAASSGGSGNSAAGGPDGGRPGTGRAGSGRPGAGRPGGGRPGAGRSGASGAGMGIATVVALAAERAVPGDIDDDMAILVCHTSPKELASAEHTFPAEPIMVSEARRLAAATFASWDMDLDQADLACLLVSEVVTNAVLHASITPNPGRRFDDLDVEPSVDDVEPSVSAAVPCASDAPSVAVVPGAASTVSAASAAGVPGKAGVPGVVDAAGVLPGSWSAAGPAAVAAVAAQAWETPAAYPDPKDRPREFVLRLRRGMEAIWVEVFDPDLRLPRLRTAGATDEGGRGLYLVEQLATRWGSRPTPEGKAVWFEIPLNGKPA